MNSALLTMLTSQLRQNLAQENLPLFLHCFSRGHEALQAIAIQIISDILSTHPTLYFHSSESNEPNPLRKPILKTYSKALKLPDPTVQSVGCTGLCKLMLANIITEPDLLRQLVVAYFDPDTQGNAGLRQALTYFLPVYCHSRAENAARMAGVVVPVVKTLADMSEEMDEHGEMVGLAVVAAQLVDWTDGRKVVGSDGMVGEGVPDGGPHLLLAEEMLEKVLTAGCSSKFFFISTSLSHPLLLSPNEATFD